MAPPGVAPGTSVVPACAHKEDKDARKLLQAGRMSGATWRSRAPSIGARPHPNQTQTTRARQASVISQRLVCSLALCEENKCAKQSPRSSAESAQRSVRKSVDRERRGPGRTAFAVRPERRSWAEFSGANVEVVSLRCHARSALCPTKQAVQ